MSNSLISIVPVDSVALLGVKSSAGLAMTKIVQLFGHELLMLFDTNYFSIEGIFYYCSFLKSLFQLSFAQLMTKGHYVKIIMMTFNGMMTSSNGNIFWITGLLCGEFTCNRWIPLIKASDAEFQGCI